MRVLIDYRPAVRARTGVGEWVHSLVAAMAEQVRDPGDAPLTVFSSSWRDRLHPPLPPAVARIDRRIPVRVLNYCWHRLEWPPIEAVAGARFDVVHSPHPLLIPSRSAAQVVTIHDLDFLDHPAHADAEVRRDYPELARRHARRADRVVVPSRHTASEVEQRLGVPAGRIDVCPNGAPAWPPRPHGPADGHILFVGALAPRKNVGGLLDAYADLLGRRPDLPPLVLAGPPGPEADAWRDRIGRPPLAGRVQRAGYLDRAALKRCYEAARMLVLPSFNEGFGLPALEAMALGVPVVASNRGALPEVVADAGLLVDPVDAGSLAAAIERMLDDEALAGACAAAGPARAARYSWRASAARLLGAYADALAARTGREPDRPT